MLECCPVFPQQRDHRLPELCYTYVNGADAPDENTAETRGCEKPETVKSCSGVNKRPSTPWPTSEGRIWPSRNGVSPRILDASVPVVKPCAAT